MIFRVHVALLVTIGTLVSCTKPVELPDLVTEIPYAADSGSLLVRCGALIDGVGEKRTGPVSVLVDQGRIESIGADLKASADIATLDLSDRTCLPGFIDMHTHILETVDDTDDLTKYFDHTLEPTLNNGRQFARVTLHAGITTVRNLGVYMGWSSRTLRDEINDGDVIGPRMQVAGFYLTIPGGGGDLLAPDVAEEDIPPHLRLGVARGADEFRQKAQDAVDGGADLLKMIASGAVLAYGGVPGSPEMTPADRVR